MSANMKQEALNEGQFEGSVYQTLYEAYRPFAVRIVFSFVIGLIGRGLLLSNANLIGFWVDSLCQPPQLCKPIPQIFETYNSVNFLQLIALFAICGFILTITFRVLFSRLSAKAVSQIYDEVTFRTSKYPLRFFDTTPTGRIVTRFSSDYGNVFRLFGGPLAEFISIIFDLIMMVVLVTFASPYYLVFILLVGFLNFVVYRFNLVALRQSRRALSASRSPSIAHFAETTQGASTIRSFRREEAFRSRFENLDQHFLSQKLKTFGRLVGFSLQMNSLSVLLLLVTGVAAYHLTLNGWVTVGSVGVAFSFIALSGNTLQMFFEWLAQFEEAMIGMERLDHYLRLTIEPGSRLSAEAQFKTGHPILPKNQELLLSNSKLIKKSNASVEFKDVWFRYDPSLPWVLKNISFKVQPGERLGIVGRTGSGKSSLIQALFYLYNLEKGQIYIDQFYPHQSAENSTSPYAVDLELYRRSMSYIAQDPTLFKGDLRTNLDPNRKLSEKKLLDVLEIVGLHSWLQRHPEALNFKIEEKGKNLSLGERQLICMARSVLQEAPIVVMDEATSSVDPQSEEIIVKATEEFFSQRTQIIIAHRLSTLEKCDRILWLQAGEIYRLGPTQEVLPLFKDFQLSPVNL